MIVFSVLKSLLAGLAFGSMFFGILLSILWIVAPIWKLPKRHWTKLWLMCIALTYIAYCHEFLEKCQRDKEKEAKAISERYEQIANEP